MNLLNFVLGKTTKSPHGYNKSDDTTIINHQWEHWKWRHHLQTEKSWNYIIWIALFTFGLFLVYAGYEIHIAVNIMPLPHISQYTSVPGGPHYILGPVTSVVGLVVSGISIWAIIQLLRDKGTEVRESKKTSERGERWSGTNYRVKRNEA